jgi:hypothetical protein
MSASNVITEPDNTEERLSPNASHVAVGDEALLQHDVASRSPVLWLRPARRGAAHAEWVRQQLQARGMNVRMACLTDHDLPMRPDPLLIVACIPRAMQTYAPRLLVTFRCWSRAPIAILTDQHDYEWGLAMLSIGADAVIAEDIPKPVALAHCLALLRRRFMEADRRTRLIHKASTSSLG